MGPGNSRVEVWSQVSCLRFFPITSLLTKKEKKGKEIVRSVTMVEFLTQLIRVELLTGTQHLGYFWSADGPGDKSVNSLGGDWWGEQCLSWHTSQQWAFSDFAYISHMHERLKSYSESAVFLKPHLNICENWWH